MARCSAEYDRTSLIQVMMRAPAPVSTNVSSQPVIMAGMFPAGHTDKIMVPIIEKMHATIIKGQRIWMASDTHATRDEVDLFDRPTLCVFQPQVEVGVNADAQHMANEDGAEEVDWPC
ncbi:unnamed protein product [Clonostachys rosea f. rosea IK726]|uniref:Uncharacterized protein n=1 Tax=Clonostachys rosea f. rosea IK726 TaxID=1349383 RepID=A0ACA9UI18_BIOOC|nr:unnamed protein product [Clonostachys rosea f. rosea IK726]